MIQNFCSPKATVVGVAILCSSGIPRVVLHPADGLSEPPICSVQALNDSFGQVTERRCMKSFLIRPSNPSILRNKNFHELQSTDLLHSFSIDTVHVVPGPLDVDHFNDALSRTLSLYPLGAGRLQRPSSSDLPWKIRLTNFGVTVTVVDSDATQIFPTNTVIQSPLHFVQSINVQNIVRGCPDEPLLRVTLTRFKFLGQTTIGLSSSHTIGDGFAVLRFVRLLSQYYQGLDPLDPLPSYQPFANPPLALDMSNAQGISMLEHLYRPATVPLPWKDPARGPLPVRVNLRFTATQIRGIHHALNEADSADGSTFRFSRQDVLTALLAHSISQADSNMPPIHYITVLMNHRGMGIADDNAVCNALIYPESVPPPASDDKSTKHSVLAITKQIRAAITHIRDINVMSAHVATVCTLQGPPAFAEMGQDFTPRPGHMSINSTWRFDWTSAHFGYPNQIRFHHTILPASRYVKIFTPNPTLLPDGKTWTVHSGDAEITFYLVEDVKERFEKILQDNAKDLGMPGEVEFV